MFCIPDSLYMQHSMNHGTSDSEVSPLCYQSFPWVVWEVYDPPDQVYQVIYPSERGFPSFLEKRSRNETMVSACTKEQYD